MGLPEIKFYTSDQSVFTFHNRKLND